MWPLQLIFLLLATPCHCHCHEIESRILKGSTITINYFPFVVALIQTPEKNKTEYVFGTGTILSENWVITAAHLWLKRDDGFVQHTKDNSLIHYGASIVSQTQGKTVAIAEIFPNEQYKDINVYYKFDVAILKTQDPIELKQGSAMALGISKKGVIHPPGTSCNLASYGKTGQDSVDLQPRLLRYTSIGILDDLACQSFIPLENGLFCGFKQNAGVCDGDSGAPLECNGFLYAIHTRGTVCEANTEVNLGQFLLLDNLRSFIRDTTGLPDV